MWYKNALIYSLDVETFFDANGDGVGDFTGVLKHVDYLETLGATCIWLQPFQPTPNRDDGYDIVDYYAIDPRLGSFGDFAELMQSLDERGIRLIFDLVVNHTSDQHPWFRSACADARSPYRDYYVWSENRPATADQGMVFPGQQASTWTWNDEAQAYYFHRFYSHQPDLNIANPRVREEILRIIGFWLRLGVAGFRIDAAPFLIELTGAETPQAGAMYAFLEEMRAFVSWHRGDAILLAEANVEKDQLASYFGEGSRLHMLFNFLANQALFLALAREDAGPLRDALRQLPDPAPHGQWAQFLRGHDELDLGRLTPDQREAVFHAFAPDEEMRIFGRGIRRRLAPMMDNDRRRIEMAHSLMLSLPGCQVIRYGDEIGMGEDLALVGREAVRTPMQWSNDRNAGFSPAAEDRLIRPIIGSGAFDYRDVNVRDQVRDPDSLLNNVQRLIHIRRSAPEIGFGTLSLIETDHPCVMAVRYRWQDRSVVVVHNLAGRTCHVRLAVGDRRALHDIASDHAYPPAGERTEIGPYGYRWFRL
ncbi:MAG: alpha-amylase family protein [Rhodospirillales bacterium]|nr:alpha-amylase family protein [Rhodospirillales bacterium]